MVFLKSLKTVTKFQEC